MTEIVKGGERFNLTKGTNGGQNFYVGLGWSSPADLDVSFFCLGADGKLVDDGHACYFNNLRTPDGALLHSPDNLDGGNTADNIGEDDEWCKIWLGKIHPAVEEISIVVTIYEAAKRGLNFGKVSKAYVHVAEMGGDDLPPVGADGKVTALVRYPLSDDYSKFTAVQVGSIYKREDGAWAFNPTGVGFEGAEIGDILSHYVK